MISEKTSVKRPFEARFQVSPRLKALIARSQALATGGKRTLYTAGEQQIVYHWNDTGNAIAARTGENARHSRAPMALGDHGCRVDTGRAFPHLAGVPSHVYGYKPGAESWGLDFAYLLDHSPAEIYDNEHIVGEFHWEMNEIRAYDFGPEVLELGKQARAVGAGGTSHGHTCPDYAIGISQGWGGIRERIDKNLKKYERLMNPSRASYLRGCKACCEAISRYIHSHADKARELMALTSDDAEIARLTGIISDCEAISVKPPSSFRQGVQWLMFAIMTDRMVGHGNGYGRADQYLYTLYDNDIREGRITRSEARELLAEMFLKLRGHFFCLGGRNRDGSDATNELSYVFMEAYDMIDDYNNLGVMWHNDMDPAFYDYACDVLSRHGAGIPSLVNYDLLVDTELRGGVSEDDAWNVAYSGCQWYCIPGKEYCDQDTNSLHLPDVLSRALKRAANEQPADFSAFYAIFMDEFAITCDIMRKFKDSQYERLPQVWPEVVTSLNCHGPIERGLDMTDARGVDYQYTSTNILGIPNVSDSLVVIDELVYKLKKLSLMELKRAVDANWEGQEPLRRMCLRMPKYGNDMQIADDMYVYLTDDIARHMDALKNNRGQEYRASLFQFQGHTCTDALFATPDGRLKGEPLAHGCNPTAGRNERGLAATARSMAKAHNVKFQGGALQIELQPRFFDGRENIGAYIRDFSKAFFDDGGFQINLNVMDLKALADAIEHPDDPAYQNIIVKVTGYTSRFICLDATFQREFVGRVNYEAIR